MEYVRKDYDFFISHASEDKDVFVRPLAMELIKMGFRVWYDEISLKMGDSLFEEISYGIKNSNFGIVVISKNFLKKEWTKKELNGLISKEGFTSNNIILPIWFKISKEEVFSFSPILADKVSITVKENEVDKVLSQILSVARCEIFSYKKACEKIEYLRQCNEDERKKYLIDAESRIKNLIYFQEAFYNWYCSDDLLGDDEWDDLKYDKKRHELQSAYSLPFNVVYNSEFHPEKGMSDILRLAKKWILQKASAAETYELLFLIDWYHELDLPFLLWGFPQESLESIDTYNLCFRALFMINPQKRYNGSQIKGAMQKVFGDYYGKNAPAAFEFLVPHVGHEMLIG